MTMVQIVDIKVGFTCNNNCLHCVVANKRKYSDLLFDEIIQEIDFFIQKHQQIAIVLTGGEFTIRQDLDELIQAMLERKQSGKIKTVQLQTNGCALADKKLVERLVQLVDGFLIALHADHPDLHDAITRTPGSFWQTVEGIQNIQDCISSGAHCALTTQTVISQFNYPILPELFVSLNEGLKVRSARLTFPHPNGNAYSREVVPQYELITNVVNQVLKYGMDRGMRIGTEQIPACIIDNYLRDFYGESILNKKNYAVGYDRSSRNSNGRIDYAETLRTEYRKWTDCAKCIYDNDCSGVWKEYMEFYGGDALKPVTCI